MNVELQQVEATTTVSDHQNDYSPSPAPSPATAPSCNEIKDEEEDVEVGSVATCRICLQSDGNQDENLISPCLCNGTQQFVHRSCLDQWRSVKEGFAFSHCTTCKAQFHLRVVEFEENAWCKTKFRLLVARDNFLMFLIVQTVIGIMGGLAYYVIEHGALRNSFNGNWKRMLSMHPIPLYYCVGVLVLLVFLYLYGVFDLIRYPCINNDPNLHQICCCGLDSFSASVKEFLYVVVALVVLFAIIGIVIAVLAMTGVIQRSWQRHYHILTKRELTQEYVVEDLNGCYTPAKLDPKYVERLKMLKLF